jgi:hypothetical protein
VLDRKTPHLISSTPHSAFTCRPASTTHMPTINHPLSAKLASTCTAAIGRTRHLLRRASPRTCRDVNDMSRRHRPPTSHGAAPPHTKDGRPAATNPTPTNATYLRLPGVVDNNGAQEEEEDHQQMDLLLAEDMCQIKNHNKTKRADVRESASRPALCPHTSSSV